MKKENTASTLVLILGLSILLALLPSPARGQTVMGQYEEEAPLATWNLFGAPGAAALGRGASLFAPGDDASVIFANPAQAVRLPGLSVSLGGGLHSASLFRFGPVNTGPISSTENLPLDTIALDFAALTLNLRGWVIGLGAGLIEIYDRPYVEAGAASYNALFTFHQEGYLRAWNISLAREIFPGLSLGLGANLVSGRWAWEMTDRWNASPRTVTITDERSRDLEGFYLNGGVVWRLSQRVSLTAAFRTPYRLSADSRSLLRYQAPGGGTDIRIEAVGAARFTRPAAAGLGVEWAARDNLRLLGEAGWWNWASYTATSFDEELPRAFRDTWRAAVGAELKNAVRLFGASLEIPTSLGLVYDRQPMKDPDSSYIGYALGSGLQGKWFRLDIGTLFGFENGSGRRLVARRLAVTLTVAAGRRLSGETR